MTSQTEISFVILRENLPSLRQQYGVKNLGIFGSRVRSDYSASSDIDILVEFDRPIDYFTFLEL